MRLKNTLCLILLALPAVAQPDRTQPERVAKLCGQIPPLAEQLNQISGMPLRHPVPCDFISKEKIAEFLNKRVKEVAKPEEVRAEELTLKKFGLVPPDFDLAKSTVDLLTEQAAAFYDYDKKKLFVTDSTPNDSQEPVLAHEIAHALADQNYNLNKYIKAGRKSDDGATARLAVMEGQATWLMSELLARKLGQSLKDSPALLTAMSGVSENGAGQFPVFDNAPLYLRQTLIFPYTKGMLFQHAACVRDGQAAFGEVFTKPPVSTQQILHPEKYFSGVQPTHPDLPAVTLKGYKNLVGGSLGELEHGILLEQYGTKSTAEKIAPHWRGSSFALMESKKEKRVVLLYSSEWDSEDAARSFFAAYRELLGKKWKQMAISSDTPAAVIGTGDDGRFELRRTGAIVASIEGHDPGGTTLK